ncbi:hypothetical protein NY2A_b048L [Paramecium bursaria Chlorella virus NY2A]|uniref:Uncharacterized protein b048L n=1 Tax=Paramecium bursaria Chlorella virus NY2A TaxID=46021 RepID=A7IVS3_PBCVN|nr:hypothetical protein NY2A_b048L [Paramecium bursaria Chlorella virus NY2A]ABT14447.1 hypothetical protein NY2A_b048L [Paramecium bursaria Chlorella virus NY2A]
MEFLREILVLQMELVYKSYLLTELLEHFFLLLRGILTYLFILRHKTFGECTIRLLHKPSWDKHLGLVHYIC